VNRAADHDQDANGERENADVVKDAAGDAGPGAEAVGHVRVQRAGGMNAPGVLGDDPAEAKDADGGDDDRQRGSGPGALAGRVQADEQGHQERDGKDGSHEPDRLGDRVDKGQRSGKALVALRWLIRHSAS
jgi:hypothetical protein